MSKFTKQLIRGITVILLSICFISSVFSQNIPAYWQFNRPGPVGYDITDICYVNNTIGYACGSPGTISRTTDAGRTWMHDYLPGRPYLTAIFFSSEKTGYVVSLDGKIAKTINRGVSWSFITSPTTATINNLYFFDDNNGFIVANTSGGAAGIFKTTNGGTTWTSVAAAYPVQNRNLLNILFINANVGYTCGQSGHVGKTTDGGVTWTNVSMVTGNPVQPGTANPISQSYVGLAIVDAQTVLVSSMNNTFVVKTTNGGTNWVCKVAQSGTTSTLGGSQQMLAMASNGNDVVVSAGANCGTSHDAGETWTFNRPYPAGNILTGVGFTSVAITADKGVKLAGAYGLMVDSASAATKWDTGYYKNLTYHPQGPRAFLGISALDKNNIVAAGNRGILYRTADGGKNWTDRTILGFQFPQAAIEYDIKDVKYVSADALYMCATNGYVYRSLNAGDTWPENPADPYYFSAGAGASMLAMDFIDKNTGWVCGGFGAANTAFVYRTTDGGLTWIKNSGTFDNAFYIYSVEFVSATTGWASGRNGRVYKTTDGGNNWVLQTVPATLATTQLFTTAFANADTGWIAGLSRIIYTTDGGTTWTQQGPTNVTANKILAVNGKTAIVFGNNGTCLRTVDGGTTWTDFSAPTLDALFGATYAVPYNSVTSGVNPANVDIFVAAGKTLSAQSPTILNVKAFYTAAAPSTPLITNVVDRCPSSLTSKGKIMNLPAYTQVNITVDGEQVLYSPQDSTFIYYEAGTTTNGIHTVVVTFTNNGGTSTGTVVYSLLSVSTAAVSIASNDADNIICEGQAVTFTATPVNGGASPAYQWKVNGVNAGTNSNVFTYAPANNDVVTVVMTSSFACVTNALAASTGITNLVPQFSPNIFVRQFYQLAIGVPVSNSSYQWYKDGQPIVGANSPTYSTTGFGTYYLRQTLNTCSKNSNNIVVGPGPNMDEEIILFPVPATTIVYAKTNAVSTVIKFITVYSSTGMLLFKRSIADLNLASLDISSLPTGVYFLKIETSTGMVTKKLVKQ